MYANSFYTNREEQKDAISEHLDKRFGRWCKDIDDDTWLIVIPFLNLFWNMCYLMELEGNNFICVSAVKLLFNGYW